MWEELGNVSLFASNFIENFRENNTQTLVISRRLKFRQNNRTESMQILEHFLECIYKDVEELWIA